MTELFHGPNSDPADDTNGAYRLEILSKAVDALDGVFILYDVDTVGELSNLRTVLAQHITASSKRHAPKRAPGRPKSEKPVLNSKVLRI